jgi:1,4-dihydroxy-2-naphthoate octaprenyltransferase
MIFMFVLLSSFVGSLQDDVGMISNIGDIESDVLELKRNEKYFLLVRISSI